MSKKQTKILGLFLTEKKKEKKNYILQNRYS